MVFKPFRVSRQLLVLSGFLVVAIGFLAYAVQQQSKADVVSTKDINPTSTPGASLGLSPASGTYKAGELFDIAITIDTDDKNIAFADLRITYNSNDLEVVDTDPTKEYPQIKPGGLFWNVSYNNVARPGTIIYSTSGGYKGTGTVATITFKALRNTSNTAVTIVYSPDCAPRTGCTSDSNLLEYVTGQGEIERLTHVTDARYVISDTPASPSPSISPSPSPSPSVSLLPSVSPSTMPSPSISPSVSPSVSPSISPSPQAALLLAPDRLVATNRARINLRLQLLKEVTLTWRDRTNQETGYEIWRTEGVNETASKPFTLIGKVDKNVMIYHDTSVKTGTTYTYVVRAYRKESNGQIRYSADSNKARVRAH